MFTFPIWIPKGATHFSLVKQSDEGRGYPVAHGEVRLLEGIFVSCDPSSGICYSVTFFSDQKETLANLSPLVRGDSFLLNQVIRSVFEAAIAEKEAALSEGRGMSKP